jgi:hypothetical protein
MLDTGRTLEQGGGTAADAVVYGGVSVCAMAVYLVRIASLSAPSYFVGFGCTMLLWTGALWTSTELLVFIVAVVFGLLGTTCTFIGLLLLKDQHHL